MRVCFSLYYRQALILLFPIFLFSCFRNSEDIPLIPPATNPLNREFIAYGVVNVSFLHVLSEPLDEDTSLGFLRRRSLVKITERRSIRNRGNTEIWVRIDANFSSDQGTDIQGWIPESSINVYNSEAQAVTASQSMSP